MNMPVRVSVSLYYSLPGFTFLKSDFVYNLQSLEYIRGSGVYIYMASYVAVTITVTLCKL